MPRKSPCNGVGEDASITMLPGRFDVAYVRKSPQLIERDD